MSDESSDVPVWIEYRGRWYPGRLGPCNRRTDGILRCWVEYAVPVNGRPGGWYQSYHEASWSADPKRGRRLWQLAVDEQRPMRDDEIE